MAEHTHHRDAVGHTSADEQYLATPPGSQYEHTDANVWIILKFLFWLAAAAMIIHVGLALLFDLFVARRTERGDPRYPLAVSAGARVPPEPRLQRFPREELMQFRIGEEAVLQNYGWADREAGTVRIPITEAMRLALERGALPARTISPTDGPAGPDMLPADSSAGRTMQRRRQ